MQISCFSNSDDCRPNSNRRVIHDCSAVSYCLTFKCDICVIAHHPSRPLHPCRWLRCDVIKRGGLIIAGPRAPVCESMHDPAATSLLDLPESELFCASACRWCAASAHSGSVHFRCCPPLKRFAACSLQGRMNHIC